MSVTFQKRQKEMKRQEKQRAKAEKRAQKKEARRAAKQGGTPDAPTLATSDQLHPQVGDDYTEPGEKVSPNEQ